MTHPEIEELFRALSLLPFVPSGRRHDEKFASTFMRRLNVPDLAARWPMSQPGE